GCQFDMKLHPPVPEVRGAPYHFVDCIARGVPHTATGEEGLIVMEILEAIYTSARKGAPVRIRPDGGR
ncbi:MAG TPA: Gfo/Idh/MocA family oxidoreductase, partial [Sumerlaeia bacterium]|nr:Gfo/Idh/MocA family oxidoreductase [Sumerlaeia bacterium]